MSITIPILRAEQLSDFLKKFRAIFRICSVFVVLGYYVTGLLIKTAIFGPNIGRGFKCRYDFTTIGLKIMGVKLKVEGQAVDGPTLYVSNHRSMLDPFVQLNKIEAFVVSKAEVAKYPVIGPGVSNTGVIFVERSANSSRSAAREAIRKTLLDGHSVLIYPEGTTSKHQTTQEFKLGSFKVAFDEGIQVVPVAIDYRDETHKWEEEGLVSFIMHKFSSKRIDTAMSIGQPVTGVDAMEVMRAAQAWIHDELIRMHASWS